MLEPEIVIRGKLNFDKFFVKFNVKKKYMQRVIFKERSQFQWKCWILDTAILLNS